MTEDPQGKKEYSDTETLKEGRGKLERKPKPQNDQTQAEALKGVKPDRTLMKESP